MEKSLFEIIKDPEMFGFAVNIYLIAKKARKACLLESTNVRGPRQKELVEKALAYARQLELMTITEDKQAEFKRYLVIRESEADLAVSLLRSDNWEQSLGRLLGFQCVGHKFYDTNRERIGKSIFIEYKGVKTDISEVCEKRKITPREIRSDLEKKVALFESVLPEGFQVKYQISELIPSHLRYAKIGDIDYVQAYLSDYINDLYNGWAENSQLAEIFVDSLKSDRSDRFHRFQKLLPLFRVFWKRIIVDDEIGQFRKEYNIPFQEGENLLIKMDAELSENIDTMGVKDFSKMISKYKAMTLRED